jgi:hypothetical protein
MKNVVDKARSVSGEDNIMVCERGVSFGYNNLVSDMRSLMIMRETGCPVVYDATHSVQLPGGQGTSSGGQREFVPVLARAAVASGIAGIFMETHPNPAQALSDGPNAWPLKHMRALLETLQALDHLVGRRGPGDDRRPVHCHGFGFAFDQPGYLRRSGSLPDHWFGFLHAAQRLANPGHANGAAQPKHCHDFICQRAVFGAIQRSGDLVCLPGRRCVEAVIRGSCHRHCCDRLDRGKT